MLISFFSKLYTLPKKELNFMNLSRLLSSPPYPVLEALGKKLSFEIAVGINGRFWVCFFITQNTHFCYNINIY